MANPASRPTSQPVRLLMSPDRLVAAPITSAEAGGANRMATPATITMSAGRE